MDAASHVEMNGLTEPSMVAGKIVTDFTLYPNGHFVPLESPENAIPVADTRERAVHLLGALHILNEASKLAGFTKAPHSPIGSADAKKRASNNPDELKGTKHKSQHDVLIARDKVLEAFNIGNPEPVDMEDLSFQDAFHAFTSRFGVGANPEETVRKKHDRDVFAKNLQHTLKELGEFPAPIAGTLSFDPTPEGKLRAKHYRSKNTQQLRALEAEPRANVVPTSHAMASMMQAMLRAVDKGQGVQGYLTMIYNANYKRVANQEGKTKLDAMHAGKHAIESMIFTWGDFLGDAMASGKAMIDLRGEAMRHRVSGNTRLFKVVSIDHPALPYLSRYRDIKDIRDNPEHQTQFDPMRNREVRGTQPIPGKNKELRGIYTSTELTDKAIIAGRVAAFKDLTVKHAERLLDEAIANERKIAVFMVRALQSPQNDIGKLAQEELARHGIAPKVK